MAGLRFVTVVGAPVIYGRPVPVELIDVPFPVQLGVVRRGIEGTTWADPHGQQLWWATVTPAGPASLQLQSGPRSELRSPPGRGEPSTLLRATGYGPGAEWVLAQAPALVGALDRPEDFAPGDGLVAQLHHRSPVRFGRTDRVFDALLAAIVGQKVAVVLAADVLGRLTRRFGEPAPGPTPRPLHMRPRAERLAALHHVELHRAGLERKRAEVLIEAARRAARLEEAAACCPDLLDARLRSISGVGPWSVALVRSAALGDPDAVPVGDFHLANHVCFGLAGEARGTDARMLELLEPYRGHRARVISLLRRAGISAPRRGPRMELLPLADFDRPGARFGARRRR